MTRASRRVAALRMAALAALALLLPSGVAFAAAPESPNTQAATAIEPRLAGFERERDAAARMLVALPQACVRRHDTTHPLFHGCIDWHSAVHGVWALVAATRITGDRRYVDEATALLVPAKIARERAWLAAHPAFEMPYGRAWFLRLAADYARATGDDRLAPMARDVAKSLVARFESTPPDPTADAYDSDSWALLNLLHYARSTGDRALAEFVAAQVRAHFMVPPAACVAEAAERMRQSFMPTCGNWAWLVGEHMPPEAFRAWLAVFLPPQSPLLRPIVAPTTAHAHGTDFARAWHLWHLWKHTGNAHYLDAYLAHVRLGLRQRAWWAGDYEAVGHWVAQFGMLGLEVSCGEGSVAGDRGSPRCGPSFSPAREPLPGTAPASPAHP
jgi:hypothetical protein